MRRTLAVLLFCALPAFSAVTRIDVTERGDIPFPNYERVAGKAYFAVDPKIPANRGITGLDQAPKNAQGKVEFSATFLMFHPKAPAKGNGTALLEISNRGRTSLITDFHKGARAQLRTAGDYGDNFLFEQGYTLVWVGWQFDLPDGPGVIKLFAPVLEGVTGLVHTEIQVDRRSTAEPLGDRNLLSYAVADGSRGSLSVRDTVFGARTPIPDTDWRISSDRTKIEYPKGFEPGRFYDFVYTGKNPGVAGLGFASVRDLGSHLKSEGVSRIILYGLSQSGRYVRSFLAEGFNADEQDKQVFDGAWAHIAGSSRNHLNQYFAQPSKTGAMFPSDWEPFSPADLLASSRKAGVEPKLILTNGAWEYWGRGGSLAHTSRDGKRDLPLEENERAYFVAGMQHVTGAGNRNNVRNPLNPQDWRWFRRAMLVSLNAWITNGTTPPPSRIPTIARRQLVDFAHWKFPKIPGALIPQSVYSPAQTDFGPEFAAKRIVKFEPPKVVQRFVALVPQVDADGNDTGGVSMPDVAVPLATYTGWNPRAPELGAAGSLANQIGSVLHFTRTRAERMLFSDPRPSLEERYRDRKDYLRKTEAAARQLVKDRFLLEQDIPSVLAEASGRWHAFTVGAR